MVLFSNWLLFSLGWYLWFVRRSHIQALDDSLSDTFEFNRAIDNERKCVLFITSFACVFSFFLTATKFYQLLAYTGLPHGY